VTVRSIRGLAVPLDAIPGMVEHAATKLKESLD